MNTFFYKRDFQIILQFHLYSPSHMVYPSHHNKLHLACWPEQHKISMIICTQSCISDLLPILNTTIPSLAKAIQAHILPRLQNVSSTDLSRKRCPR